MSGHTSGMDRDPSDSGGSSSARPRQQGPTTDRPLHGPERRTAGPALITVGLLLAVLAIFALIMFLRYNT